MLRTLEVLAVLLVAISMALALAHAIELPGKMRLSKDSYLTTRSIYYAGFTVAGIAEPLGKAALLVLLLLTPAPSAAFG
jgi:hypothetical protein